MNNRRILLLARGSKDSKASPRDVDSKGALLDACLFSNYGRYGWIAGLIWFPSRKKRLHGRQPFKAAPARY
jgi:hypothetical protein